MLAAIKHTFSVTSNKIFVGSRRIISVQKELGDMYQGLINFELTSVSTVFGPGVLPANVDIALRLI